MSETVKEQILAVRETGRTNMFDVRMVVQIAIELGYDDLVEFLMTRTNRKIYCHFILTGEVR